MVDMTSHDGFTQRSFRDADTYLIKFQQLQSKALVLVKLTTVETLKSASAEVRDALAVCFPVSFHTAHVWCDRTKENVCPALNK
jgi:hypothetical protein